MGEEHSIIKDTVIFSVCKYISFFLIVITTTYLLKQLSVSIFGLYSALMLILEYTRFAFLPLYSASYKKIPFIRGKGRSDKEIQEVRDLTFGPTFYIMLLIAVGAFISSFILNYSHETLTGLRLLSAIILFQHFNFFQLNFLRIDKRFWAAGILNVVLSASKLILVLLLAGPYGLDGVLAAFIISYIITTVTGLVIAPYKFSFSPKNIRKKALTLMIKSGILPALVYIISTAFLTVDKWMVIKFYTTTLLGYYGFAVFIIEIVGYIPQAIGGVMFPRQIEAYGRWNSYSKMKNYILVPTTVIAYSIPFIIAGAFFFLNPFVNFFVPKYIPAVPIVYILMFAAFFASAKIPITNFLISINFEWNIIVIRTMMIAFVLVLNIIYISQGYGLLGVALATLIAYLIEFFIFCFYTLKTLRFNVQDILKSTGMYMFPFAYMALLFYALGLFDYSAGEGLASFIVPAVKYVIFCILNIPLLYYVDRKTRVISMLYKIFVRDIWTNISRLDPGLIFRT